MKHGFLYDFFSVSAQASRIKQNEEKRAKSVRFGITSILFSIVAVAFSVGGALLLKLLLEGNEDALVLFIFTIAGLAVCFGGTLSALVGSLMRVIAQLSINRKAIGWVALALLISAVAAIILILVFLS